MQIGRSYSQTWNLPPRCETWKCSCKNRGEFVKIGRFWIVSFLEFPSPIYRIYINAMVQSPRMSTYRRVLLTQNGYLEHWLRLFWNSQPASIISRRKWSRPNHKDSRCYRNPWRPNLVKDNEIFARDKLQFPAKTWNGHWKVGATRISRGCQSYAMSVYLWPWREDDCKTSSKASFFLGNIGSRKTKSKWRSSRRRLKI